MVNLNDDSLLLSHSDQLPPEPSRDLTDPPILSTIFKLQVPQNLLPIVFLQSPVSQNEVKRPNATSHGLKSGAERVLEFRLVPEVLERDVDVGFFSVAFELL